MGKKIKQKFVKFDPEREAEKVKQNTSKPENLDSMKHGTSPKLTSESKVKPPDIENAHEVEGNTIKSGNDFRNNKESNRKDTHQYEHKNELRGDIKRKGSRDHSYEGNNREENYIASSGTKSNDSSKHYQQEDYRRKFDSFRGNRDDQQSTRRKESNQHENYNRNKEDHNTKGSNEDRDADRKGTYNHSSKHYQQEDHRRKFDSARGNRDDQQSRRRETNRNENYNRNREDQFTKGSNEDRDGNDRKGTYRNDQKNDRENYNKSSFRNNYKNRNDDGQSEWNKGRRLFLSNNGVPNNDFRSERHGGREKSGFNNERRHDHRNNQWSDQNNRRYSRTEYEKTLTKNSSSHFSNQESLPSSSAWSGSWNNSRANSSTINNQAPIETNIDDEEEWNILDISSAQPDIQGSTESDVKNAESVTSTIITYSTSDPEAESCSQLNPNADSFHMPESSSIECVPLPQGENAPIFRQSDKGYSLDVNCPSKGTSNLMEESWDEPETYLSWNQLQQGSSTGMITGNVCSEKQNQSYSSRLSVDSNCQSKGASMKGCWDEPQTRLSWNQSQHGKSTETTTGNVCSEEQNRNYSSRLSVGSKLSLEQDGSKNERKSQNFGRVKESNAENRRDERERGVSNNTWNREDQPKDSAHGRRSLDALRENRRDQREGGVSNNTWNREDQPKYTAPGRRTIDGLFATLGFTDSDKEWNNFIAYIRSKDCSNFVRVTEDDKDLFVVDKEYALAHCVAEDMNMGSGIAVDFRRLFKNVHQLLQQNVSQGGLAVLEENGRYIYYMVTKKKSSGKPTYHTFWSSLIKLRDHMVEHKVEKLAIPRIGCGLDRLEWSVVKPMIEFSFRKTNVEILVCNFQQDPSAIPRSAIKKCKIVQESYHVSEIEKGTIILYFASCRGAPTQTMEDINAKFNFMATFKNANKALGQVVRSEFRERNYILYGCIVRETDDDMFDFLAFDQCLKSIQKGNMKDNFNYVAFQKIESEGILNSKILNLMRHTLRDVDIYICDNSDSRNDSWMDCSVGEE